jgi:hypothetical protein
MYRHRRECRRDLAWATHRRVPRAAMTLTSSASSVAARSTTGNRDSAASGLTAGRTSREPRDRSPQRAIARERSKWATRPPRLVTTRPSHTRLECVECVKRSVGDATGWRVRLGG